ncbi:MAG: AAA family ATPase [Thiotrichales bacterium]|nr:MAG: AAA family ATPase [Thiotrichales bacterium]
MNVIAEEQPELIRGLLRPDAYDHPVSEIRLIETHISWVILTGNFAYKIKKPVNLGFLDFSTLDKRRFCCNEELRLNSRLAAPIYLEVLPITGSATQPALKDQGEAIEYVIKMIQFPQQAQLDNMLADGKLDKVHMDAIATLVAGFHQRADVAADDSVFGDPEHVYQPVAENFLQIRQHLHTDNYDADLAVLEDWSRQSFESLQTVFKQRKRDGFIRECHGDMHLRNLVWFDGEPLAFDCLEFNPALRWIDTLSEVAFLVMDLQDRQQPELAQRFLNSYLEKSGDYQGLQVLRFYLVYRALVRAKVDAIRAGQAGISDAEKHEAEKEFLAYLELARSYTRRRQPALIITRGLSASGKSTITQPLLELIGAIRIRSDVERKRLFGILPDADGKAAIGKGIYSAEAGIKTYQKLAELADTILAVGFTVIVDAAFLEFAQREPFSQLANKSGVPFIILEFTASADTLRQRIKARTRDVSDADLSVLEHQLATTEPIRDSELSRLISINTEATVDASTLRERIHELIENVDA